MCIRDRSTRARFARGWSSAMKCFCLSKIGSLWLHVAYCTASPKSGMTSDIFSLQTRLNHNGINTKETRVEQLARKLWVFSLWLIGTSQIVRQKITITRLPADWKQYVHQCNDVINLIKSRKSEHYSSIIKENSGNQKVLFKTVQKLLQKPTVNYYLHSENDCMLADELATFFTIRLIHYIMISLLKRRLLLIQLNVLLMRYSLCL